MKSAVAVTERFSLGSPAFEAMFLTIVIVILIYFK